MTEAERLTVQAWLKKSQSDLGSAKRLAEATPPFLDTAIYHCQQCAEKAMRGFLIFLGVGFPKTHDIETLIELAESVQLGVGFPKTHDIETLIELAESVQPEFSAVKSLGVQLTGYATFYRYPDDLQVVMPTEQEVADAIKDAETLYAFVLTKLPNKTHP